MTPEKRMDIDPPEGKEVDIHPVATKRPYVAANGSCFVTGKLIAMMLFVMLLAKSCGANCSA